MKHHISQISLAAVLAFIGVAAIPQAKASEHCPVNLGSSQELKTPKFSAFRSFCPSQTAPVAEEDESASDLKFLYKVLSYFKIDEGRMPKSMLELGLYAKKNRPELDFWNVAKNAKSTYNPEIPPYYYIYEENNSGPRNKGEMQYYFYTDVEKSFELDKEPYDYRDQGYYFALDEKGDVFKVPFDAINYHYTNHIGNNAVVKFPNQVQVQQEQEYMLSYSEFESNSSGIKYFPKFIRAWKPKVNDAFVEDNNGPEALLTLSRRLSFPSAFGVSREDLWAALDASKAQFTLAEVRSGAMKLGLDLEIKEQQTLADLQASHTPALLFLPDDGRIVTLIALDDDRAVIVDRGVTQNIERSVLEQRYSGQALIPATATTRNAALVADDAVREVKLASLDAEVSQRFTLRNSGTAPVTLQLEYPLLGVTESKLSANTIAPGETATLDIKAKWRPVLRLPYQNILISLRTNDPIAPRLQLAVLLTPPENQGD